MNLCRNFYMLLFKIMSLSQLILFFFYFVYFQLILSFIDHPILQILENRIGDKIALDFVKKQKQRFATT